MAGQLREALPVLLEHVVAVRLAVHLALVTPRARYDTLADLISTWGKRNIIAGYTICEDLTYFFSRTFWLGTGWFYDLWFNNCTLSGGPWCRALQSIFNFKQQVRVAGQL